MSHILTLSTDAHPAETSGILLFVRVGLPMVLAASLAVGCAGPTQERRDAACRVVQDNRDSVARASGRALIELSLDTPAEADARNAYAQQISDMVLNALGGATLLVGLIDGFATDPATQPGARNAAYGLGGGALASFAIAWLLSYTQRIPRERARRTLLDWSQRCR